MCSCERMAHNCMRNRASIFILQIREARLLSFTLWWLAPRCSRQVSRQSAHSSKCPSLRLGDLLLVAQSHIVEQFNCYLLVSP